MTTFTYMKTFLCWLLKFVRQKKAGNVVSSSLSFDEKKSFLCGKDSGSLKASVTNNIVDGVKRDEAIRNDVTTKNNRQKCGIIFSTCPEYWAWALLNLFLLIFACPLLPTNASLIVMSLTSFAFLFFLLHWTVKYKVKQYSQ